MFYQGKISLQKKDTTLTLNIEWVAAILPCFLSFSCPSFIHLFMLTLLSDQSHLGFGVTLKYTIPKEILNKTWLVIEDHKYIYITGKKLHFYSVGFRDKRFFLMRKTGVEFHGLPGY